LAFIAAMVSASQGRIELPACPPAGQRRRAHQPHAGQRPAHTAQLVSVFTGFEGDVVAESFRLLTLRARFFAMTYDRQMAKTEKAGLSTFRQRLLADATGDVIEIGGGTGANLRFYGPAVESLTMTEPEPAMLRNLQRRIREHRPATKVLRTPAEDLPFDDHTFDVAVSTLVLCGVDDQPRALRELRRVLRPGGRLLFIEHVRSGDPGRARLQDRMNWLNRLVVCCDCNRPTLDSIRRPASPSPRSSTRRCRRLRSSSARPSWAAPRPRRRSDPSRIPSGRRAQGRIREGPFHSFAVSIATASKGRPSWPSRKPFPPSLTSP
jgi:SAM-dependent methyltransferase